PATKLPPAVMMSLNAPPLMLMSSVMPSNVLSILNRFLKLNCAAAELIAMLGVTRSDVLVVVMSGVNTSFGALAGFVVDVTQSTPLVPVCAVAQPAGSAGTVTPSNASLKPRIG